MGKPRFAAYAAILGVVLLWGSAASVGRYLGDAATPLELAVWRLLLGLTLLLAAQTIIGGLRGGRRHSDAGHRATTAGGGQAASPGTRHADRSAHSVARLAPVWLAGVLGYGVMIWLFFAAARLTLASHLVLILSMAPICTLLISRLSGGDGRSRDLPPALLSLAGATVMAAPAVSGTGASLTGDALAILAMLAFSAYTVLTSRYGASMPALRLNIHGMSAGLLFLWAMMAATQQRLWPRGFASQEQWLAIGYLGAAATGLAYVLYALALARLPMARVVPFIYLQPIVGVLLSALWLGERLTWNVGLGMVAIMGGLLWNHALRSRTDLTSRTNCASPESKGHNH